jgi:transcriptional regulator with XRE-family HTH domain
MSQTDIGKALLKYRMKRRWTLQQLSNVTGVSVSALWYAENGKVNPHELTKARITDALPDLKWEDAA